MYGFSTPTIIHALTTYLLFLLVSLTEVLTLEEQLTVIATGTVRCAS